MFYCKLPAFDWYSFSLIGCRLLCIHLAFEMHDKELYVSQICIVLGKGYKVIHFGSSIPPGSKSTLIQLYLLFQASN